MPELDLNATRTRVEDWLAGQEKLGVYVGTPSCDIRSLVAELDRLRAGADPTPGKPDQWLTPGEIWHRLLRREPEARLEFLARVGEQMVQAERCTVTNHDGRIAQLEGEVDRLRANVEQLQRVAPSGDR